MSIKTIREFFRLEAASGILLLIITLVALIWANSPLDFFYQALSSRALVWVNDGLMSVFFLLVGLELKRYWLDLGNLKPTEKQSTAALPLFAALGGVLIPAFIYGYLNYPYPLTFKGWPIPIATDIAFAVGVLTLFGKRVPPQLKLFLLALAIFDDLLAILVIAFFYTQQIAYVWLFLAALSFLALCCFNQLRLNTFYPYLIVGFILWLCLFFSHIHPTLSGVLLAFTIPTGVGKHNLLHRLEQTLHPWVAFLIMPLFALMNAGFALHGLSLMSFRDVVVLGIALSLFLGKPIGVFGFAWTLIRLKIAKLPEKVTWLQLYGVSQLCGIGFTMSLFLGTLSFPNDSELLTAVRLGVLAGSLLSGLMGSLILLLAFSRK